MFQSLFHCFWMQHPVFYVVSYYQLYCMCAIEISLFSLVSFITVIQWNNNVLMPVASPELVSIRVKAARWWCCCTQYISPDDVVCILVSLVQIVKKERVWLNLLDILWQLAFLEKRKSMVASIHEISNIMQRTFFRRCHENGTCLSLLYMSGS